MTSSYGSLAALVGAALFMISRSASFERWMDRAKPTPHPRCRTQPAESLGIDEHDKLANLSDPWSSRLNRARDALAGAGFSDLVEDLRNAHIFEWIVIHDATTVEELNKTMGLASGLILQRLDVLWARGYVASDDFARRAMGTYARMRAFELTDKGLLAAYIVRDELAAPENPAR